MASAKSTVDHDEIREWVEARGGYPARVKRTGDDGDPGILRIDYPGFSGEESLQRISWDEWLDAFDENGLAFLFQDERRSRFSKLVKRTTKRTAAKKTTAKKATAKTTASKRRGAPASSPVGARASRPRRRDAAKPAAGTAVPRKASAKSTPSKKSTASKKSAASSSTASAKRTTSHSAIRRWVEARGGWPATVKATKSRGDAAGLLRIDYPGYTGAGRLERISWDDFFDKFDREKLAFLYQEKPRSRFSKLVRK